MRQERIQKRPLRRRQSAGGGGGADAVEPVPGRPPSVKRTLNKTDDLLRRLDRLIQHTS